MCRVPPKIATLEVQNRETATCRDLLLLNPHPHVHVHVHACALVSNHACCWCYSPAGERLLVLSWWWVTWSCCSLYNKLTLSRQFELFRMRHAARLPLLSLRVDMLRLANTLTATIGTPLLSMLPLITLLCHMYHSTMWPTVVVLYLDLARITHCCSATYCVCVKDSASAIVSTLQAYCTAQLWMRNWEWIYIIYDIWPYQIGMQLCTLICKYSILWYTIISIYARYHRFTHL